MHWETKYLCRSFYCEFCFVAVNWDWTAVCLSWTCAFLHPPSLRMVLNISCCVEVHQIVLTFLLKQQNMFTMFFLCIICIISPSTFLCIMFHDYNLFYHFLSGFILFSFFGMAFEVVVSPPGIEPWAQWWKHWGSNHWTAREFLSFQSVGLPLAILLG